METIKQAVEILKPASSYSRVSTLGQEDEQTSLNQIMAIEEYAKKMGYVIVRKYVDEGWSGDVLCRPALDELRQDAQNKEWDTVIIYDPDRLARRYSYQELIMDELKEAGVDVLFVTMSIAKTEEERILQGVRGLFAEFERAKIGERFRMGKLRKAKSGHVLVSEAPYGYKHVLKTDDRKGYYEILKEEASIVKMIFSWVADEKNTIRTVVKRLQDAGISPRKSKRGVWNTSTLSNMLRNETYIGKARWGSSTAIVPLNPQKKDEKYKRNKKTSKRIKPKEEWMYVPVPRIIEDELFQRARKQVEDNFSLCQRNKKNEYLLSGRMICGCGRKRTGEGGFKGKYLYYRCNDRVLSFPLPKTCMEGGINARIADELVWKKISQLMMSPNLLRKNIERWHSSQRVKIQTGIDNVDILKSEIEKLKSQEDKYNKAYAVDVISLERLKEYTTSIRERIKEIELKIKASKNQAREQNINHLLSEQELNGFAEKVKKDIKNLSFQSKKEIILSTVNEIIGTPEKLCVSGYIPVNNLYEYKTSHRHRRSPKRRQVNAL